MRPPAYLVGERVGFRGFGAQWGVIAKIERNVIALMLDAGGALPIKRGPDGFNLVRHGDRDCKFTYQDPKGLEESKRCLREAVKQLKSLTRRESFLAGKVAGRAIKYDKWAEDDRKYDELTAAKKALPVLIKLVRAWNSIPDSSPVPEQINDSELWDEAKAIVASVVPTIFEGEKDQMTDSFQQAVDAAGENMRRKPRRSVSDEARLRMQTRSITCGQCGQVGIKKLDGSQCGGLAGVQYKVCDGCGWTRAITKRRGRFKL